jgi:CheY-like chemotaxis protein
MYRVKNSSNEKILIVEDCDEDFDTAVEALEHTEPKPQVYRAVTGDECLAQLHGSFDVAALHPDMILMDLDLPGTDGREALHEIKTDQHLKTIPVVVFTTSAKPSDLATCYALGANAFHVKPFYYPEHLKTLETVLDYWLNRVRLLK